MTDPVLTAAGLGAVTGLRTMQGVAWIARALAGRRLPSDATRLQRWLGDENVSVALAGLAVGELVVDKLPGIPARITPGPLFGRAVLGGVVGAAVGGRDQGLPCALAGAGAAVVAAGVGWLLRGEIARATLLPDPAVAVAEDAVAVLGGRSLAARV